MATTYIALGSNMGDRQANLLFACDKIAQLPATHIAAKSQVYETEPVGPGDQSAYLNAVIKIETSLLPDDLLAKLNQIEKLAGRVRFVKWGPRTLDLDILLYDQIICQNDELVIPHPYLHERRFVLKPLCDLASEQVHPTLNQTFQQLLDACLPMEIAPIEIEQWSY